MAKRITVAVGDIHGCFDQLTALLQACEAIAGHDTGRFVFLGDYVDRGANARQVVDLLMQRQRDEPDRCICLRGNHEEMLVRAAAPGRSDRDFMLWWGNGGGETLDSYRVSDPADLPADHLAWMKQRPISFADERRLFVHAGIRPNVPVESQSPHDMLWIREPFLSSDADHGAFIVHGHTPTETGLPELRPNRLNLDTGACFGGLLTAAVFADDAALPKLFVDSSGATRDV